MGLTWSAGGPDRLIRELPRKHERFMAEAEDVIREVVEQAARIQRESIDRIDTGLMRGSVGFKHPTRSGNIIEGTFGWTENQEMYFAYQEYGTMQIVPMHAMTDALSDARERFLSMIIEALRRSWS